MSLFFFYNSGPLTWLYIYFIWHICNFIKVGTHDATSPCDWSLRLVAGTSPIVCADLKSHCSMAKCGFHVPYFIAIFNHAIVRLFEPCFMSILKLF